MLIQKDNKKELRCLVKQIIIKDNKPIPGLNLNKIKQKDDMLKHNEIQNKEEVPSFLKMYEKSDSEEQKQKGKIIKYNLI